MSINLSERPGKKALPETEPELYLTFSRHFLCFPGCLKISLWKQDSNRLPQRFLWMAFLKHPGETPGRLWGVCYSQSTITQLQGLALSLPAGFPHARRLQVPCLSVTIRGLQHFLVYVTAASTSTKMDKGLAALAVPETANNTYHISTFLDYLDCSRLDPGFQYILTLGRIKNWNPIPSCLLLNTLSLRNKCCGF